LGKRNEAAPDAGGRRVALLSYRRAKTKRAALGCRPYSLGGTVQMDQPVALLGTPNTHFLSLIIIIGGLAGWIGGMIVGRRHGLFTNILVGIAGSWIGSELASMAGVAVYGSVRQFVAALVGSIILLVAWQALSGRSPAPR
jgi:uncharacterized membrane protein YeaQ/YmgE (transglycosylase-associated protein family)